MIFVSTQRTTKTKMENKQLIKWFVVEGIGYEDLEINVYQGEFAIFDGTDEIWFDTIDACSILRTLQEIEDDTNKSSPQLLKLNSGDLEIGYYLGHISICFSNNPGADIVIEYDVLPDFINQFKDNLGV